MTRETKVGLLVGLAIILLIGIIVSDHLSVVQHQNAADLTQFAQQAQRSVEPSSGSNRNASSILRGRSDSAAFSADGAAGQAAPMVRTAPLPLPGQAPPSVQQQAPVDSSAHHQIAMTGPDQRLSQQNVIPPVLTLSHTQPTGVGVGSVASQATTASAYATGNGSAPQPIIHYVRAGESLWTIAQQYYDDGNYWQTIADANPKAIQPTGGVREGVRLVIPNKAGLANKPAAVERPANQDSVRTDRSATPTTGRSEAAGVNQKVIEVRAGDTLSSLSQEHLGSHDRWSELFEANRDQLKRPDQIRVGMKLRVSSRGSEGDRPSSKREQGSGQGGTASVYVVQPNDSLSSIAGKVLGDPGRWADVYEANRDQLRDPDALQVGQRLKVPRR